MPFLSRLTSLCRNLFSKERMERELAEEIRAHLEMLVELKITEGLDPAEARRRALIEMRGEEQVKESVRAVRIGYQLDTLLQDLRYGVRMLMKHPGFTLISVLTLALGIGACTAIFSVVYTVLLRPLPFADQERLVMLWKRDMTTKSHFVELALAEVKDWQQQSQCFESLAVMPATVYGYGYLLTGRGDAVMLESAKVSGRFFSQLGVQPKLGRVINDQDDQVNAPKVVVISDRVWRERFNAAPQVIGQTVSLTEEGFMVIGVMPAEFEFPKGADIWLPLSSTMNARAAVSRGATFLQAVGKLKPGITQEQAEAEMNTIIARLAAQYPETRAFGHRIVITPLASYLFGDARPALWLLLAATGILLLIAVFNIANLLLAQATARRREFALRAALGAGRIRLIRQLLSESLVLASGSGITGVCLASGLIKLIISVAPSDIPRIADVRLNITVLIFGLGLTSLTAFICGLIPALTASRLDLNAVLSEGGGKIFGEPASLRARGAVMIAEVAVTVVLLTCAILILRSFVNLSRINLGFDPHRVLTMQLRVRGEKYSTPEARRAFYHRLIDRLEEVPGVEAASAVLIRPLEGTAGWEIPFVLEGQSGAEAERNQVPNFEAVTLHYFRTFKIPIKAGREFSEQDTEHSLGVAIISETMATTLFGSGVDSLGKRFRLDIGATDPPTWLTIVGVAGDARYREFRNIRFDLYVPFAQWPSAFVNHFAVRTTAEPTAFITTVRREVARLDPTQAVGSIAAMEELVAQNLARPRFSAVLLNWLATLALLLAAVGIYGGLAYSVAQRTGEFGTRIALGAQIHDILRLVIGQGMRLVLAGIGIGLVSALGLTRLLKSLLFGINANDPLTFGGGALLLLVVALIAIYIPARRATKVDPMISLRLQS